MTYVLFQFIYKKQQVKKIAFISTHFISLFQIIVLINLRNRNIFDLLRFYKSYNSTKTVQGVGTIFHTRIKIYIYRIYSIFVGKIYLVEVNS